MGTSIFSFFLKKDVRGRSNMILQSLLHYYGLGWDSLASSMATSYDQTMAIMTSWDVS